MAARYLVDRSVLSRLHHDDLRARVEPLLLHGRVASCGLVDLGLLSRARRPADHTALRNDLSALPHVDIDESVFARALDVQAGLAALGRQRAVVVEELLLAAAAERCGLTVLHYDAAFDLIAEVTDQPTEWAAAKGSVP